MGIEAERALVLFGVGVENGAMHHSFGDVLQKMTNAMIILYYYILLLQNTLENIFICLDLADSR